MIKAEWTSNDALSAEQTTQTNAPNALNALDCISRQSAIDAFEDTTFTKNEISRRLSDLPPVQPEQRWIPVTERLPEDGQRVLVTYDLVNSYPWVNILRYGKPMFEDKPCFYEVDSEWGDVPYDGIVAWMPLPKPYREDTEDAVH